MIRWIRLCAHTPVVLDDVTGEKILPATWGPVEEEPVHAMHPDEIHPDPRVRFARSRLRARATACGKEVDPRLVFIEPHKTSERCAACVEAVTLAKSAHEAAAIDLAKKRAEVAAKRKKP